MRTHRPLWLFCTASGIAMAGLIAGSVQNPNLWSTPDQRGDRLFQVRKYTEAAAMYTDPFRRGVALYRANDYPAAAASFATVATPESAFNQGNALVLAGKYAEAITSYDRALALRPGWTQAEDNRAIARIRRDRLTISGGEDPDGQVQADSIVFDKNKHSQAGEHTEMARNPPLTDAELRGLWLRRVQTKPADFLRAKFAFQAQKQIGTTP